MEPRCRLPVGEGANRVLAGLSGSLFEAPRALAGETVLAVRFGGRERWTRQERHIHGVWDHEWGRECFMPLI